VSSTFQGIPTGDGTEVYYRLEACQNGYCSAIRAGGVKNRTPGSGNNFYVTASYGWFYANANVALRNYTASSHTAQLYDGVPGYGGTVKLTCSLGPSSTCGPATWGVYLPLSWYVTGTQTQGATTDNAPVRLLPQPDGQNAGS
jgi:hypothetical protein